MKQQLGGGKIELSLVKFGVKIIILDSSNQGPLIHGRLITNALFHNGVLAEIMNETCGNVLKLSLKCNSYDSNAPTRIMYVLSWSFDGFHHNEGIKGEPAWTAAHSGNQTSQCTMYSSHLNCIYPVLAGSLWMETCLGTYLFGIIRAL